MGQSIQHITLSSIADEALKTMAENTNKYILEKDYRLGKGYCKDKQRDMEILYSIIHLNYCDLTTILEDSISGVEAICMPNIGNEDMCQTKSEGSKTCTPPPSSKPDSGLYELWKSRGNSGTMDDFLDAIFKDEKMNWYEMHW